MSEENKIERKAAEAEFQRWADGNDLDVCTDHMDAEDLTAFDKGKRRMLDAIQRGALVVNDKYRAVYTAQDAESSYQEPLIFGKCTGASLMAMDGKKKNHDVRKTYAVMAEMCNVPMSVISGMVGIDSKICRDIFLFLMD